VSFSKKKRFLAGATCPRCSAQDKIRVYSEDDTNYRECVSCGFKDEIHINSAGREMETRVNRTEQEKLRETQVLQFPPLDEEPKP